MRFFLYMFSRASKAKEIPELTQFLVNNPMFRSLANTFHNSSQTALRDIDSMLEKNLLTKEEYDRIYSAKRIGTKNKKNTNRQ